MALTQPDPGVLRKAQRGDERAFSLIVRAYEQPVYFVRGQAPAVFAVGAPFRLLIANSGQRSPTRVAVNDVRAAFERMMRTGPEPAHAAAALRAALERGRSGTVRTGRMFQATIAPLLARFGSLSLKRRIQEKYFDL